MTKRIRLFAAPALLCAGITLIYCIQPPASGSGATGRIRPIAERAYAGQVADSTAALHTNDAANQPIPRREPETARHEDDFVNVRAFNEWSAQWMTADKLERAEMRGQGRVLAVQRRP